MKVFIAAAPNGLDAEAQMVTEYSIRKFTSVEPKITWLIDGTHEEDPLYDWDMGLWETPYCGFRWAVPELCDFEGDALYINFNNIVLSDLDELMQIPWDEDAVLMTTKKNWFNIIRFNNSKIQKYLPSIADMKFASSAYEICAKYFIENKNLVQWLPGNWSPDPAKCIEDLEDRRAVYYEDLYNVYLKKETFPRLSKTSTDHWFDQYINPEKGHDFTCELFDNYFNQALNADYRVEKYINEPD